MSEPQILEGDLKSTDLPQVLKTLAVRQSTGILTVQGEEDIVAVSCLNGHIVTADSLNQTQEENLGELLVSQNLVPKANFDAVVLEHQGSGGSLGDLLIGRGLISRQKLLECFRLQTFRLMLQILTWRQGEYKFYGGDEVSYEKGVTPISVEEMLMRALAELGQESGVGGEVPRLDAVYRKVPPPGPVRVYGSDGSGGPGTWITEAQKAFLDRMDGRTSAFDVARSLGAGRFKTLFSLHQLIQNDLIELVRAASAQTGPAPEPAPGGVASSSGATAIAPAVGLSPGLAGAPPAEAPQRQNERDAAASRSPSSSARVQRPAVDEDDPAVTTVPATPRPWIGPALAALLLTALGMALLERPTGYLLPFPWQSSQRGHIDRQMRQILFQKVDDAVATYYLMEFQYPRNLEALVERGLLSPGDTRDLAGESLRYIPQDSGYQIAVGTGEAMDVRTGSIRDDFVRDPDYFPEEVTKNPLVLLD